MDWLASNSAAIQALSSIFSLLFLITATAIAYKTYTTAAEASQRQLRAYLGLETLDLNLPSSKSSALLPNSLKAGDLIQDFVLLSIKNFGATPANKVSCHVSWINRQFAHSLEENYSYPDLDGNLPDGAKFIPAEAVIFPQTTWHVTVAITDISPFRKAKNREETMFLYGHIDYEDIYGNKHTSKFCYNYQPFDDTRLLFIPIGPYNKAC